jgi:hypothetical protein
VTEPVGKGTGGRHVYPGNIWPALKADFNSYGSRRGLFGVFFAPASTVFMVCGRINYNTGMRVVYPAWIAGLLISLTKIP